MYSLTAPRSWPSANTLAPSPGAHCGGRPRPRKIRHPEIRVAEIIRVDQPASCLPNDSSCLIILSLVVVLGAGMPNRIRTGYVALGCVLNTIRIPPDVVGAPITVARNVAPT